MFSKPDGEEIPSSTVLAWHSTAQSGKDTAHTSRYEWAALTGCNALCHNDAFKGYWTGTQAYLTPLHTAQDLFKNFYPLFGPLIVMPSWAFREALPLLYLGQKHCFLSTWLIPLAYRLNFPSPLVFVLLSFSSTPTWLSPDISTLKEKLNPQHVCLGVALLWLSSLFKYSCHILKKY